MKIINHTHVRFSSKRCAPACRKQSSWLGMHGTCIRRCQTVLPCWWANRPPGCEISRRWLWRRKRKRQRERERNERNMINGCQRVGKITNRMEEREREGSKEDPNCASLTLDALTLHADGLPVEVPGDIRLRFALHLAQNGGILSLLNGQHGVLFGKRNFLCVSMWGIQCKINESFAALDTLGYLSVGGSSTILTIYNQIVRFAMQPAIGSLAGPIALVRERNVCENDFQLFCVVRK